jgi:hypothetical protein
LDGARRIVASALTLIWPPVPIVLPFQKFECFGRFWSTVGLATRQRKHRLEQLKFRIWPSGLRPALFQSSPILQFQSEAEEFGSADHSVVPCHSLGFIVKVEKGESISNGEGLHILKGVLWIARSVIGAYGSAIDAKRLELVGTLDDAVNNSLPIRTVIADEHNDGAVLAFELGKSLHLSIGRV